jgi:lipid-binding SYLF domain-containing protein
MNKSFRSILAVCALILSSQIAQADDYSDTVTAFQNAGETTGFFRDAYGYAVFPSIGKAGFGIGGAHGKGRVFTQGAYIGDSSMTQITVGFQLGGQIYSQMILFEDQRSLEEFISGNF